MKFISSILVFLILFTSCGAKKDTSDPVAKVHKDEVSFAVNEYPCAKFGLEKDHIVFETKTDLQAFYEKNVKSLGKGFQSVCERYDEAYFQNQILIAIKTYPDYATRYTVECIRWIEKNYEVSVRVETVVSPTVTECSVVVGSAPTLLLVETEAGVDINASNVVVKMTYMDLPGKEYGF